MEGFGPPSTLEVTLSPRLLHVITELDVSHHEQLLGARALSLTDIAPLEPISAPSEVSSQKRSARPFERTSVSRGRVGESTQQPSAQALAYPLKKRSPKAQSQAHSPQAHSPQAPRQLSAVERWRGHEGPRYALGLEMSPVPSATASWWRRVSLHAPERSTEAVITLGDSLSATSHFLRCFADTEKRWGQNQAIRATLKQLGAGWGEGSALSRVSHAAIPGAPSWQILREGERGERSPLERELKENKGRFAFVLFGTNDLNYHRGVERFLSAMWTMGETLISRGVIPIYSTLPHRLTSYADQVKVLDFNFVVRVISALQRAPLIDLYSKLAPLRLRGLRSDKIHLNAYKGGCDLRAKGLRFGHNVRNYLSLKALASAEVHLAAAALRGGGAGPVPEPPRTPTTLPELALKGAPWSWLGDPQLVSELPARPASSCRELREGGQRGFALPITLKKAREVSILHSELPVMSDAKALSVLIEVYHPSGEPLNCVKPNAPLDQRPLPAGRHLVWVLSADEATEPYLFAIERRR